MAIIVITERTPQDPTRPGYPAPDSYRITARCDRCGAKAEATYQPAEHHQPTRAGLIVGPSSAVAVAEVERAVDCDHARAARAWTVASVADLTDEEIAALREFVSSPKYLESNLITRLLDEVERRRERDARTLALLQRIEWGPNEKCADCRGLQPTHRFDCDLAKLIAQLSGVTSEILVVTNAEENADGTVTVTADSLHATLDAPETPEETATLDKLTGDPEQILKRAQERQK